jgi:translation elongation factor EF-Tu-like GTPase
MTGDGWEFVVERVFNITGRGTAVAGVLRGVFDSAGQPAKLVVGEEVRRIERVYLEFLREQGGEGRALMLYGVSVEEVPVGSIVTGPAE